MSAEVRGAFNGEVRGAASGEVRGAASGEAGPSPMTLAPMFDALARAGRDFKPSLTAQEVGRVISVATGVARVSGLPGAGYDELLRFAGGLHGIAFNLDEDEIGVVLLDEDWRLKAGDPVERTGRVMDVAVGDHLLGRVIDPLGRPLDGGPVPARGSACRSSGPRRRSWTAHRSAFRCRPG